MRGRKVEANAKVNQEADVTSSIPTPALMLHVTPIVSRVTSTTSPSSSSWFSPPCSTSHDTLTALAKIPSTVTRPRLERNLRVSQLFTFLMGLSFLSPIFVLYLKQHLHESTTTVSYILAFQAITIFGMELPSGMLADLVGRKYCLIACVAIRMVGLLIISLLDYYMESIGLVTRFCGFLLAALCEGCSQALGSGTDIALIHDSLSALDRRQEFHKRLSSRSMMWPLAACLANLVGGLLAEHISMSACIYSTLVTTLLTLPLTLLFTEVYPRVYDPLRVWRKRHQRRCPTDTDALIDRNLTSPSPPATQAHVDQESIPLTISRAIDHRQSTPSNEKERWRQSTDSSTNHSSGLIAPDPIRPTSSTSLSPDITGTKNGRTSLLIVPPTIHASDLNSPLPCPSPLASLPPVSIANFWSLTHAHFSLCMTTLSDSTQLRTIILLSSSLYAFAEPLHRLRAVFFQSHHIPPSEYGLVSALMFGLSSFGAFLSPKLTASNWFTNRTLLIICSLIPPILNVFATYTTGRVSALLLLPISLLWGIRLPILAHLLHCELHTSNQRATVASIQSLANKLFLSIIMAFIAGPLTDAYSIDLTVRVFALLAILPVIFIIARLEPSASGEKETTNHNQQTIMNKEE